MADPLHPESPLQPGVLGSPDAHRPGRVLVLGGSGYLGRHTGAAFLRAGWQVTLVSRSADTLPPWDDSPPGRVRREALDVAGAGPGELAEALGRIDPQVVVNAAGAVWAASEEEMTRGNVHLVERLLTVLPELPRRPRLLQLGTVHEYGPPSDDTPVTEAAALRPVSPYGRTKARASEAVLAAARKGDLDTAVLRISNSVGARLPRPSLLGGVAAQLAAAPVHGLPSVLRLGPLETRRDFVDVTDVAEAVVAASTAPVTGKVVNIGRGESVAAGELVRRLVTMSGRAAEIAEPRPAASAPSAAAGGAYAQQLDISLARRQLKWRPGRELDESLRSLWHAASEMSVASGQGAGQ